MARLLALCLSLALIGIAAENSDPAPPKLQFDMCPLCQMATGILEMQLKAIEKETKTIDAILKQTCISVALCEDMCELFVHQFAGLFAYAFSIAEYSLDGFCAGVFFCPPPFYEVMGQNGLFGAACQICEQTLTAILGTLTSDKVAAKAQEKIVKICSSRTDKKKCMETVGGALMQAMQGTKAILDPTTFCTAVGPCAFPQPTPSKSPVPPADEDKLILAKLDAKAKYPVA